MGSSKSPKPVIVSYWYKCGIQFIPCYGPVDAITEVRVDDRTAWGGSQTVSGSVSINNDNLFGGKSKEGGIKGTMLVKMGEPTQSNSGFGGSGIIPAYRGLLSIVYRGIYSAGNPYMKPWAFKLRRILKGWHNDSVWYAAKATITLEGVPHMNPAHIIYQCVTDPEWGMGYPTSSIDETSFTEAADTLYSEGFGLSLTWNQQGQVKNFITEVLDHIYGVLRNDPNTGKFVLKLIRDDYDPDTLDVYDESDIIELDEYQRISWGETINEVTVKFVEQTNGKVTAVTVHDLANVQAQGSTISKTAQYAGIPVFDLAVKVAMRELKLACNPLAKVRLKINRNGWRLLPGDVFKLSFPKLGIESAIMRVVDASIGSLESNVVTVSALEDVFGLPDSSYIAQQPIGWVDPTSDPADSPFVYVTEVPYWGLTRIMSRADLDYVVPDDCYMMALSKAASGDAGSYSLWTRTGSDPFEEQAGGAHCPTAELLTSIGKTDTVLSYNTLNALNLSAVDVGTYAFIENSGSKYEIVEVTAITDTTITVVRGILDTVPQAHSAGAQILFADGFESSDGDIYLPTEVVDAKIQTKTGKGYLDLSLATIHSATMAQRQYLPYAPGLFRLNAAEYPTYISGNLTVSWAHRDRLQQTGGTFISQYEASIGPEAGTTYTVKIYGENGTLVHTEAGLTGTSYAYPKATEETESGVTRYNRQLRVTVTAVRSGLDSWTSHDHTFDRAGYGLNYGYYYGGGV